MVLKVLVLWADSKSANLGVRVLAHGTEALIREAWGADTIVEFQDFEAGDSSVAFNKKGFLSDVGRPWGQMKKKIRAYDVVVDTGAGDSFTTIYGAGRHAIMTHAQWTVLRLGKVLILSPQTVGPFDRRYARWIARGILRRATVVMTRDSVSATYSRSLGRAVDAESTDVVFALPVPVVSTRHGVVLNVSGLLWNQNPHVPFETYRSQVRELIVSLLAQSHRVTLLAHVIDNDHLDNDVIAIRDLEKQFGKQVEYFVPSGLDEARELVASAELVIGSRMHACLNALSTGTPTVPWAYSRKFAPLFADLGWSHVIDIRSTPDAVPRTMDFLKDDRPASMLDEVQHVLQSTSRRIAFAVDALRSSQSAAL